MATKPCDRTRLFVVSRYWPAAPISELGHEPPKGGGAKNSAVRGRHPEVGANYLRPGRASKNEDAPNGLRGLGLGHRHHGAGGRAVGPAQLLQKRGVIGV